MIALKDIEANYSGIPSPKYANLIHKELISRVCNVKYCAARINEDCKNRAGKEIKDVHIGRVPDNFDSLEFLVDYFNKNPDEFIKYNNTH